jgi:hypothetical protein
MPNWIDPLPFGSAIDKSQARMWVGIYLNGGGILFNITKPNMRKSLVLGSLASSSNRFCICIFNCPTSSLIRGFDKIHRLTRSNNSSNFQITNELTNLGFFRAISKIRPELTGLTNKRLINARKGMEFLSHKLNSINSYTTVDGVAVVNFQEDRIHSWEKTQELRTGK